MSPYLNRPTYRDSSTDDDPDDDAELLRTAAQVEACAQDHITRYLRWKPGPVVSAGESDGIISLTLEVPIIAPITFTLLPDSDGDFWASDIQDTIQKFREFVRRKKAKAAAAARKARPKATEVLQSAAQPRTRRLIFKEPHAQTPSSETVGSGVEERQQGETPAHPEATQFWEL